MMTRVLCIGEVMVELSGIRADGAARVGFGGDTANTAIYLSRILGVGRVGYLTRLGEEPFGAQIADALIAEGVDLPPTIMCAGRQTGLYAITLDDTGERSFTYWRTNAPVRNLLDNQAELDWAEGFDALYISGITLAVLRPAGITSLLALMAGYRNAGKLVMLDTNLRPSLWRANHPDVDPGDIYRRAASCADIVKTGADEVQEIFGANGASELACPELVITDGPGPVYLHVNGAVQTVRVDPAPQVVDATAAGDSFNAAYLGARLQGAEPPKAVMEGHALARKVIAHHGAIIPKPALPAGDEE